MGLFNKKPKLEDAMSFYNNCIVKYHDKAKEHGLASRGLIFIPELIPLGEKAILKYLQDPGLQQACGSPAAYYYTVMVMALRTGLVFAATWHEDYAYLKNKLFNEVAASGPSNYMGNIVERDLQLSNDKFMSMTEDLFSLWLELHKPYWDLQDPREYTFKDLLAVYQLGISMELSKLGY